MTTKNVQTGYLPDERPPIWQLFFYALQQVIVMFPATVAVALITHFHISTTIFASGLATLFFILITGRKIPLYYGSSFSYVAAIGGLMAAQGMSADLVGPAPDALISAAQFGIIMSGLISIAAGLLVKFFGSKAVEKLLPASVTGPVAIIIGLSLAGVAMGDAFPSAEGAGAANNWGLLVAVITLISTILFSVYLKGFFGQLPLLLGPLLGCVAAFVILKVTGVDLFKALPEGAMQTGVFALPHFTLPTVSWAAVLAIMPIAIATIPESTAHIYQLDIYVNDLSKKKGGKKYNIAEKLWLNLIGDGIGDMVSGVVGGPAGTNYGENISAMAITRVFSIPVLVLATIIAMIISCFTPLINLIYAIPQTVIGGLEVFLFGAIAAQGIAIMVEKKVDLFSAKNIAVIALIMVMGVGGTYAFPGGIPMFGANIPAIAGASVFGIILNLILSIGEKNKTPDSEEISAEAPEEKADITETAAEAVAEEKEEIAEAQASAASSVSEPAEA